MSEINRVEKYDWCPLLANVPIRRIPLTRMQVDRRYQREQLSESKVLDIARAWNPAAVGVLTVSLRLDGMYYLIDGQHRWGAAMRRGDIQALECRVCQGLTIEQEAALFRMLNLSRTNVNSFVKFRSALVAGDPATVECAAMLKRYGLGVKTDDGSSAIRFPDALVKAWSLDAGAAETAIELVRVMVGDRDNISRDLFQGMFYILRRCDILKVWELAEKVYARGGKELLDHRMRSMSLKVGMSQNHARVAALGILSVLNEPVSAKRRLTLGADDE